MKANKFYHIICIKERKKEDTLSIRFVAAYMPQVR